jgi:hypothetical protein
LIVVAETADTKTIVSPQRTVTAPSASFPIRPVSMLMDVEPTWLVTVCMFIGFYGLLLFWVNRSGDTRLKSPAGAGIGREGRNGGPGRTGDVARTADRAAGTRTAPTVGAGRWGS